MTDERSGIDLNNLASIFGPIHPERTRKVFLHILGDIYIQMQYGMKFITTSLIMK